MKIPTIIITMDYEIWGDGSGDVNKLVIEPTDRLLKILKDRNIKMTVFFEVEEFLIFKKYAKALKKYFGYDPALLIEEQLATIVYEGHEIGLHLHPQWINATFDGNRFKLFPQNQSISDVYKNEQEIFSYINERLTILRTLTKKYNPKSEISCFRAGGFALCPEKLTLKVLYTLGIKADSSVIKGLYRKGKCVNLDYRDAPYNSGFWLINDDVCRIDKEGKILEFTIYSKIMPEYKKLSFKRIKQKFFPSRGSARLINAEVSVMALPKTPWGFLYHFFNKTPIKFDYCHMTLKEMLSFLYDSEKENGKIKYPLTIIGHSKEFFNDNHFITFLDTVIQNNQYEFRTMGEITDIIEGQNK